MSASPEWIALLHGYVPRGGPSWMGFYTTGTRAGTWRAFTGHGTMAALVIDNELYGYEFADGWRECYGVRYRCEAITPMPGSFWLTETYRERYEGIL